MRQRSNKPRANNLPLVPELVDGTPLAGKALVEYTAVDADTYLESRLGQYVQNAEELLDDATRKGKTSVRVAMLRILIATALSVRKGEMPAAAEEAEPDFSKASAAELQAAREAKQ